MRPGQRRNYNFWAPRHQTFATQSWYIIRVTLAPFLRYRFGPLGPRPGSQIAIPKHSQKASFTGVYYLLHTLYCLPVFRCPDSVSFPTTRIMYINYDHASNWQCMLHYWTVFCLTGTQSSTVYLYDSYSVAELTICCNFFICSIDYFRLTI